MIRPPIFVSCNFQLYFQLALFKRGKRIGDIFFGFILLLEAPSSDLNKSATNAHDASELKKSNIFSVNLKKTFGSFMPLFGEMIDVSLGIAVSRSPKVKKCILQI